MASDPFTDDGGMEAFEQTLCQVRTVHVFKIPPRVTSGGYRAGDWKDEVWQGSLKVVQKGQDAAILLIDPKTNALFAMCPVKEGSVERCVDSSRYFVLKIQNAQGRHAFIGVAFNEREEAFDFNVALQEYEKDKEREEKIRNGTFEQEAANQPKLDLSLKEGQKISIKLPSRSADGTPAAPAAASSAPARKRTTPAPASGFGGNGGLLPPPPGSGGLLAPPPSSSHRAASPATASALFDPLSDANSTATVASTASSSSTLSSFDSFGNNNGNNGNENGNGGNSQPSGGNGGFSGFDAVAFDPLVPTPVGSRAGGQTTPNNTNNKATGNFSALDDWMGVASSLPAQGQGARPAGPVGAAMKPPASSSDPFAGLADFK